MTSQVSSRTTTARIRWRLALGVVVVATAWLAFSPRPPAGLDSGWDKLDHLAAFLAHAVVGAFAFPAWRQRRIGLPLALLAWGVTIELVQRHIPGRSADWQDVVADAVGIALGLWLAERRLGR